MSVMLLTEQDLEFLSLKGGCTGSSESTLVKMPHCWKSRVTAHIAKLVAAWLCLPVNNDAKLACDCDRPLILLAFKLLLDRSVSLPPVKKGGKTVTTENAL